MLWVAQDSTPRCQLHGTHPVIRVHVKLQRQLAYLALSHAVPNANRNSCSIAYHTVTTLYSRVSSVPNACFSLAET